jgi:subtilase family serine protease
MVLAVLASLPHSASAQAQAIGRVQASAPIALTLSLPPRHPAQLADLLRRLYDPQDPGFHQFLTPTQFAAAFSPTAAEYQAVADAARAQGLTITGSHSDRLLLDVSGRDDAVEHAFGVHLTEYAAANGRFFHAPDTAPTLPTALSGQVSGVIGLDTSTVRRPHLQQLLARSAASPLNGSGPEGGLSPLDIKAAYGLDSVTLEGEGQSLAVFELDGYTQSDIRSYENHFGLPQIPIDDIFVDGVSGQPGGSANEATLDIELVAALAPRIQKIIVYEGPNTDQGIVDTYDKIANDDQAKEISTSWGSSEGSTDSATLNAESVVFKQMAAQGQTIFAATGDNGAEDNGTTLSVDDPGSQPYMTAVGGTNLVTNATGGTYHSETVWNAIGSNGQYGASGGGISSYWNFATISGLTDYQQNVETSTTYRKVPDVSLNADPDTGYAIYFGGQWVVYGGTSTDAPLWAGFTALVNQQRALLGESTLGFANPAIYQIGAGANYSQDFHDVTQGNNDLTQTDPAHYPATTGYDLATGWGSFNGAHLLADLAGDGATAPVEAPGPYTYPTGWNLLSLPYNDSAYSPNSLFGFSPATLYVWNQANGLYTSTPTSPADHVRPAVGYWLYVPNGTATTRQTGTATNVNAPYTIPALTAGWNQIGDPFPYPIALTNLQFTNGNNTKTSYIGAEEAGWISGQLYQYDNTTGNYVPVNEGAALTPGVGDWLYAYQPVSLQVPPP